MRRLVKLVFSIAIIAVLIYLCFAGYNKAMKFVYPLKYTEYVEEYSSKNKLDEYLVYAVIKCESSFKPDAHSSADAIGLMQMKSDTFDWVRSKYPDDDDDLSFDNLYDPQISIEYGTYLLKLHLDEFDDERTAVAAYHAGRGKVNEWLKDSDYSKDGKTLDKIEFGDTDAYVKRVMKAKETYTKLYGGNENE